MMMKWIDSFNGLSPTPFSDSVKGFGESGCQVCVYREQRFLGPYRKSERRRQKDSDKVSYRTGRVKRSLLLERETPVLIHIGSKVRGRILHGITGVSSGQLPTEC